MNATTILDVVTLFCAGILAGMEIVIHYGLRAPAEELEERAQIQLRQALILRLRILVPAFFFPALVAGVAVALRQSSRLGFWFQCAGLVAMLIWIVIRVIGTVPLNSATLTWKLDAPPTNWKTLINHAERFHTVGVLAAVTAFALFLAALTLS
jgi:hypothetical protein